MVLEIAEFSAKPGYEDDFATAFMEAVPLAAAIEGFRSARLTRGIESPSKFVALIEWDNMEDHTVKFRQSDNFLKWRDIVSPFFEGDVRVQHSTDV
jgi:heme-degrading monooxygenase HmoA